MGVELNKRDREAEVAKPVVQPIEPPRIQLPSLAAQVNSAIANVKEFLETKLFVSLARLVQELPMTPNQATSIANHLDNHAQRMSMVSRGYAAQISALHNEVKKLTEKEEREKEASKADIEEKAKTFTAVEYAKSADVELTKLEKTQDGAAIIPVVSDMYGRGIEAARTGDVETAKAQSEIAAQYVTAPPERRAELEAMSKGLSTGKLKPADVLDKLKVPAPLGAKAAESEVARREGLIKANNIESFVAGKPRLASALAEIKMLHEQALEYSKKADAALKKGDMESAKEYGTLAAKAMKAAESRMENLLSIAKVDRALEGFGEMLAKAGSPPIVLKAVEDIRKAVVASERFLGTASQWRADLTIKAAEIVTKHTDIFMAKVGAPLLGAISKFASILSSPDKKVEAPKAMTYVKQLEHKATELALRAAKAPSELIKGVVDSFKFIGTDKEPKADFIRKAGEFFLAKKDSIIGKGLLGPLINLVKRAADPKTKVEIADKREMSNIEKKAGPAIREVPERRGPIGEPFGPPKAAVGVPKAGEDKVAPEMRGPLASFESERSALIALAKFAPPEVQAAIQKRIGDLDKIIGTIKSGKIFDKKGLEAEQKTGLENVGGLIYVSLKAVGAPPALLAAAESFVNMKDPRRRDLFVKVAGLFLKSKSEGKGGIVAKFASFLTSLADESKQVDMDAIDKSLSEATVGPEAAESVPAAPAPEVASPVPTAGGRTAAVPVKTAAEAGPIATEKGMLELAKAFDAAGLPDLAKAARYAVKFIGTDQQWRAELYIKAGKMLMAKQKLAGMKEGKELLGSVVQFMVLLGDASYEADPEKAAQAMAGLEKDSDALLTKMKEDTVASLGIDSHNLIDIRSSIPAGAFRDEVTGLISDIGLALAPGSGISADALDALSGLAAYAKGAGDILAGIPKDDKAQKGTQVILARGMRAKRAAAQNASKDDEAMLQYTLALEYVGADPKYREQVEAWSKMVEEGKSAEVLLALGKRRADRIRQDKKLAARVPNILAKLDGGEVGLADIAASERVLALNSNYTEMIKGKGKLVLGLDSIYDRAFSAMDSGEPKEKMDEQAALALLYRNEQDPARREEIGKVSEGLASGTISVEDAGMYIELSKRRSDIKAKRAKREGKEEKAIYDNVLSNVDAMLKDISLGKIPAKEDAERLVGSTGVVLAMGDALSSFKGSAPEREELVTIYGGAESYVANGDKAKGDAALATAKAYASSGKRDRQFLQDVDAYAMMKFGREFAPDEQQAIAEIESRRAEAHDRIEKSAIKDKKGAILNIDAYYDEALVAYIKGDKKAASYALGMAEMYEKSLVAGDKDAEAFVSKVMGDHRDEKELRTHRFLEASYKEGRPERYVPKDMSGIMGQALLSTDSFVEALEKQGISESSLMVEMARHEGDLARVDFFSRSGFLEAKDTKDRYKLDAKHFEALKKDAKGDEIEAGRIDEEENRTDYDAMAKRVADLRARYDKGKAMVDEALVKKGKALDLEKQAEAEKDEAKKQQMLTEAKALEDESASLYKRGNAIISAADEELKALSGLNSSIYGIHTRRRESGRWELDKAAADFAVVGDWIVTSGADKMDDEHGRDLGIAFRLSSAGSGEVDAQKKLQTEIETEYSKIAKDESKNEKNGKDFAGIFRPTSPKDKVAKVRITPGQVMAFDITKPDPDAAMAYDKDKPKKHFDRARFFLHNEDVGHARLERGKGEGVMAAQEGVAVVARAHYTYLNGDPEHGILPAGENVFEDDQRKVTVRVVPLGDVDAEMAKGGVIVRSGPDGYVMAYGGLARFDTFAYLAKLDKAEAMAESGNVNGSFTLTGEVLGNDIVIGGEAQRRENVASYWHDVAHQSLGWQELFSSWGMEIGPGNNLGKDADDIMKEKAGILGIGFEAIKAKWENVVFLRNLKVKDPLTGKEVSAFNLLGGQTQGWMVRASENEDRARKSAVAVKTVEDAKRVDPARLVPALYDALLPDLDADKSPKGRYSEKLGRVMTDKEELDGFIASGDYNGAYKYIMERRDLRRKASDRVTEKDPSLASAALGADTDMEFTWGSEDWRNAVTTWKLGNAAVGRARDTLDIADNVELSKGNQYDDVIRSHGTRFIQLFAYTVEHPGCGEMLLEGGEFSPPNISANQLRTDRDARQEVVIRSTYGDTNTEENPVTLAKLWDDATRGTLETMQTATGGFSIFGLQVNAQVGMEVPEPTDDWGRNLKKEIGDDGWRLIMGYEASADHAAALDTTITFAHLGYGKDIHGKWKRLNASAGEQELIDTAWQGSEEGRGTFLNYVFLKSPLSIEEREEGMRVIRQHSEAIMSTVLPVITGAAGRPAGSPATLDKDIEEKKAIVNATRDDSRKKHEDLFESGARGERHWGYVDMAGKIIATTLIGWLPGGGQVAVATMWMADTAINTEEQVRAYGGWEYVPSYEKGMIALQFATAGVGFASSGVSNLILEGVEPEMFAASSALRLTRYAVQGSGLFMLGTGVVMGGLGTAGMAMSGEKGVSWWEYGIEGFFNAMPFLQMGAQRVLGAEPGGIGERVGASRAFKATAALLGVNPYEMEEGRWLGMAEERYRRMSRLDPEKRATYDSINSRYGDTLTAEEGLIAIDLVERGAKPGDIVLRIEANDRIKGLGQGYALFSKGELTPKKAEELGLRPDDLGLFKEMKGKGVPVDKAADIFTQGAISEAYARLFDDAAAKELSAGGKAVQERKSGLFEGYARFKAGTLDESGLAELGLGVSDLRFFEGLAGNGMMPSEEVSALGEYAVQTRAQAGTIVTGETGGAAGEYEPAIRWRRASEPAEKVVVSPEAEEGTAPGIEVVDLSTDKDVLAADRLTPADVVVEISDPEGAVHLLEDLGSIDEQKKRIAEIKLEKLEERYPELAKLIKQGQVEAARSLDDPDNVSQLLENLDSEDAIVKAAALIKVEKVRALDSDIATSIEESAGFAGKLDITSLVKDIAERIKAKVPAEVDFVPPLEETAPAAAKPTLGMPAHEEAARGDEGSVIHAQEDITVPHKPKSAGVKQPAATSAEGPVAQDQEEAISPTPEEPSLHPMRTGTETRAEIESRMSPDALEVLVIAEGSVGLRSDMDADAAWDHAKDMGNVKWHVVERLAIEEVAGIANPIRERFLAADPAERALVVDLMAGGMEPAEAFAETYKRSAPKTADEVLPYAERLSKLPLPEAQRRIEEIRKGDPLLANTLSLLALPEYAVDIGFGQTRKVPNGYVNATPEVRERLVLDYDSARKGYERWNAARKAEAEMTPEIRRANDLAALPADELRSAYERGGPEAVLEGSGIHIDAPRDEMGRHSRAVFDVMFKGGLEGRIASMEGFEGASITGFKFLDGLSGAYVVEMSNGKKVIVKTEDMVPAIFGQDLARNEGMISSEHTGYSYDTGAEYVDPMTGRTEHVTKSIGIIEDIHDYAAGPAMDVTIGRGTDVERTVAGTRGRRVRILDPHDGVEKEITVVGVATWRGEIRPKAEADGAPDPLPRTDNPATVAFYALLSTPEGRQQIFEAWRGYHELSRRALLDDRALRNSVFVIGIDDRGGVVATFQPIDMDSTGRDIGMKPDGSLDLTRFNRDFVISTEQFESEVAMASASPMLADAGIVTRDGRNVKIYDGPALDGTTIHNELFGAAYQHEGRGAYIPPDRDEVVAGRDAIIRAQEGRAIGIAVRTAAPGEGITGSFGFSDIAGRSTPHAREDGRFVLNDPGEWIALADHVAASRDGFLGNEAAQVRDRMVNPDLADLEVIAPVLEAPPEEAPAKPGEPEMRPDKTVSERRAPPTEKAPAKEAGTPVKEATGPKRSGALGETPGSEAVAEPLAYDELGPRSKALIDKYVIPEDAEGNVRLLSADEKDAEAALIGEVGAEKIERVFGTIEGMPKDSAGDAHANVSVLLELAKRDPRVMAFLKEASDAEILLIVDRKAGMPAVFLESGYFDIILDKDPVSRLPEVGRIPDKDTRDTLTGILAMREFRKQRAAHAGEPQETRVRPLGDFVENKDPGLEFLWTFGLDPRMHESVKWEKGDLFRRAELYYDVQEFMKGYTESLVSISGGRQEAEAFARLTWAAVTRQDVADTNLPYTPHGWAHSLEVVKAGRAAYDGMPRIRTNLIEAYGTEAKARIALDAANILHDIGYGSLGPKESKGEHPILGAKMFDESFRKPLARILGVDGSSRAIEEIFVAIDRHGEDKPDSVDRYMPANENDHPLLFVARLADNLDMTGSRMREIQTDPVMIAALKDMYDEGARVKAENPKRPGEDDKAYGKRLKPIMEGRMKTIKERYIGVPDSPGLLASGRSVEDFTLASELLTKFNETTWPHFEGCNKVLGYGFGETEEGQLVVNIRLDGRADSGYVFENDATVDAALYQVYRAHKSADSLTYGGKEIDFNYKESNEVYIEGVRIEEAHLRGEQPFQARYERTEPEAESAAHPESGAVPAPLEPPPAAAEATLDAPVHEEAALVPEQEEDEPKSGLIVPATDFVDSTHQGIEGDQDKLVSELGPEARIRGNFNETVIDPGNNGIIRDRIKAVRDSKLKPIDVAAAILDKEIAMGARRADTIAPEQRDKLAESDRLIVIFGDKSQTHFLNTLSPKGQYGDLGLAIFFDAALKTTQQLGIEGVSIFKTGADDFAIIVTEEGYRRLHERFGAEADSYGKAVDLIEKRIRTNALEAASSYGIPDGPIKDTLVAASMVGDVIRIDRGEQPGFILESTGERFDRFRDATGKLESADTMNAVREEDPQAADELVAFTAKMSRLPPPVLETRTKAKKTKSGIFYVGTTPAGDTVRYEAQEIVAIRYGVGAPTKDAMGLMTEVKGKGVTAVESDRVGPSVFNMLGGQVTDALTDSYQWAVERTIEAKGLGGEVRVFQVEGSPMSLGFSYDPAVVSRDVVTEILIGARELNMGQLGDAGLGIDDVFMYRATGGKDAVASVRYAVSDDIIGTGLTEENGIASKNFLGAIRVAKPEELEAYLKANGVDDATASAVSDLRKMRWVRDIEDIRFGLERGGAIEPGMQKVFELFGLPTRREAAEGRRMVSRRARDLIRIEENGLPRVPTAEETGLAQRLAEDPRFISAKAKGDVGTIYLIAEEYAAGTVSRQPEKGAAESALVQSIASDPDKLFGLAVAYARGDDEAVRTVESLGDHPARKILEGYAERRAFKRAAEQNDATALGRLRKDAPAFAKRILESDSGTKPAAIAAEGWRGETAVPGSIDSPGFFVTREQAEKVYREYQSEKTRDPAGWRSRFGKQELEVIAEVDALVAERGLPHSAEGTEIAIAYVADRHTRPDTVALDENLVGMPSTFYDKIVPVIGDDGSMTEAPLSRAPRARLLKKIGVGSGGTVYLAEMDVKGETKVVAVKVFKDPRPDDGVHLDWDGNFKYFKRELEGLGVFKRTGIGTDYFGVVSVEGNYAMAMEYIPGEDTSRMSGAQIKEFVKPDTFIQIEKKWQELVDAGYQQGDFQFAILFPVEDTPGNSDIPAQYKIPKGITPENRDRWIKDWHVTINGEEKHAGDVVFLDAGSVRPINPAYPPESGAEMAAFKRSSCDIIVLLDFRKGLGPGPDGLDAFDSLTRSIMKGATSSTAPEDFAREYARLSPEKRVEMTSRYLKGLPPAEARIAEEALRVIESMTGLKMLPGVED